MLRIQSKNEFEKMGTEKKKWFLYYLAMRAKNT